MAEPLSQKPLKVLITGAAGQIGYALAPMVARGAMLGANQTVILHLLDIPFAAESLEGVRMELVDAAFPLVKGARGGEGVGAGLWTHEDTRAALLRSLLRTVVQRTRRSWPSSESAARRSAICLLWGSWRSSALASLQRCACPPALIPASLKYRLAGIVATTDLETACKDVDVAGAPLDSAQPLARSQRVRSDGRRLPSQGRDGAEGGACATHADLSCPALTPVAR